LVGLRVLKLSCKSDHFHRRWLFKKTV